jgi:hypothetical protein
MHFVNFLTPATFPPISVSYTYSIFGEEYKLWGYSLCNFLPPVTPDFPDPNTIHNTLPSVYTHPLVSLPHKTTDTLISRTLIFTSDKGIQGFLNSPNIIFPQVSHECDFHPLPPLPNI